MHMCDLRGIAHVFNAHAGGARIQTPLTFLSVICQSKAVFEASDNSLVGSKREGAMPNRQLYCGKAVPPSKPREEDGLYWGYTVRLASGLGDVFAGCPFPVPLILPRTHM